MPEIPEKPMKYCSIALSKYRKNRKSRLALLRKTWNVTEANGPKYPFSCLPHEYVRLIYVSWLLLCFIQMGLGIILFFGNVINTAQITDTDDTYLFFQPTYHETTYLVIYGESTILILSSIGGVMLSYYSFPSAHIWNIQYAFAVCFLCTVGTIWFSIGMQHWPDKDSYLNNLQVEAYYRNHSGRFQNMWNIKRIDDNIWDTMQKDLQCCGYKNYMDWIFSHYECIPVSCCKTNRLKECTRVLSGRNKRLNWPDDSSAIDYVARNLIWGTGCFVKLEEKFSHEKMFWMCFSIACLWIQGFLTGMISWITYKIIYYTASVPGGRRQMQIFRKRFYLLKSFDAMVKGIQELDNQIIAHEDLYNDEVIDWKNFVLMSLKGDEENCTGTNTAASTSTEPSCVPSPRRRKNVPSSLRSDVPSNVPSSGASSKSTRTETFVDLHHSVSGMVLVPSKESYVRTIEYDTN